MKSSLLTVGWREWAALPDLGLPYIKAKIDSGKHTSILHTFMMENFDKDGVPMVRFGIHPHQHTKDIAIICEAPIVEERTEKDPEGLEETYYVIETNICLGETTWPIKLLLSNKDELNFRLLLGHSAIDKKLLIDPSESFLLGKIEEEKFISAYTKTN